MALLQTARSAMSVKASGWDSWTVVLSSTDFLSLSPSQPSPLPVGLRMSPRSNCVSMCLTSEPGIGCNSPAMPPASSSGPTAAATLKGSDTPVVKPKDDQMNVL